MYINFWYPICTSAELDEENPRRIEMLNMRLVAFRAESGSAHVLADTCIHRGGSLSKGKTKGEHVQCPYHGWEFSGDGKCQFIPSMPDSKPPARAKVDSYPVQEKYGIVFAFLGDLPEAERPPLFEIAEWGEEGNYQGYQSENEVFLAVAQGKADIGITTNTAVLPITQQYDTLAAGPRMPWTTDYTSVVGKREDVSWLNYLNLFVTHQARSGRYTELWGKYVGGEAPELRIPGVMY